MGSIKCKTLCHIANLILGDPASASRGEGTFKGESLQQEHVTFHP